MMHKVTKHPRGLIPAEVASLFRVNPKTVTRWMTDGRIAAELTPGGHRRFAPEDVRVLLVKKYQKTPEILAERLSELEVLERGLADRS